MPKLERHNGNRADIVFSHLDIRFTTDATIDHDGQRLVLCWHRGAGMCSLLHRATVAVKGLGTWSDAEMIWRNGESSKIAPGTGVWPCESRQAVIPELAHIHR